MWKAPELLRDPSLLPTCEADIYTFGLLIYSIITGQAPYEEENIKSNYESKLNIFIKMILPFPWSKQILRKCWWNGLKNKKNHVTSRYF